MLSLILLISYNSSITLIGTRLHIVGDSVTMQETGPIHFANSNLLLVMAIDSR